MSYGTRSKRGHVDPEKVLERVHTTLYTLVGQATETVTHMESQWSQGEMTKRIVRYIYTAAKDPELLNMPWEQAARQLVEHAMGTYSTACQERPWFWELQLHQAFAATAWELCAANGRMRATFEELEEFVHGLIEEHLDKILLAKAIWEAAEKTFQSEAVVGKIYKAFYYTYPVAVEECQAVGRPGGNDLQAVQHFTKRWTEAAMQRAWNSVEDSERTLTEGNVSRLLQNLIAPFGDEHEYSCIPQHLYEKIGRPPRTWGFIKQTVNQLFAVWRHSLSAPASASKRRRGGGGNYNEVPPPVPAPEVVTEDVGMEEVASGNLWEPAASVDEAEAAGATSKHPQCTSGEDCMGTTADCLVRHIMEGDPGDIYCQACWAFFLKKNTELEGTWEDGEKAGTKFEI